MADTIWVKSGLKDNKVALWEVDEAHPGGEVYIADSSPEAKAIEVAKTSQVMKFLGEGRLVEANKGGAQIAADKGKGKEAA